MTISFLNQRWIDDMIKDKGEEEALRFARDYYGIPEHITSWEEISKIAYKEQEAMNKRWNERKKPQPK